MSPNARDEMLIIYIIILVARQYVCVFTNSSEALGQIDFILGGNVQLMPGSNINYIS